MHISVKIFIAIVIGSQLSCDNSNKTSNTKSITKTKIQNQTVNIAYDDSKTGDTTLLFIHGWNIDKSYWADQSAYFSKKYRVVAIDLPGFGESGKNRKDWSVEEYGMDVTRVLDQLNLKNVIVIGHSMSGAIALETALTNPERVIGIVGVDNFTNIGYVPSPKDKLEADRIYTALRTNYKQATTDFANQYLFSPSTESRVRKRVINDFTDVDSVVAVTVLENNDQYRMDQKLKSLNKTVYLINSNYRPTDTLSFKKIHLDYDLLSIGPTGHYPMIEKPKEFNMLLEQVIKKIGKYSGNK